MILFLAAINLIASIYNAAFPAMILSRNGGSKKVLGIINFCILLELQSTVDYSMPIRLLYYTTEIWRKYLKGLKKEEVKRKSFKLPAVVPIVLYNGKDEWTATRNFKEKVQRADLFNKYVVDFSYILINVNQYTKEDLLAIQNTVSAIFLLDQKIDSLEFLNRIALIATEFHSLSEKHRLKIKDWLDNIVDDPRKKDFISLIDMDREEIKKMTANITQTLIEEREQAKAKGIEEGIQRERLSMAKKMLQKGISIEDIMEMTGLERNTIEELKH